MPPTDDLATLLAQYDWIDRVLALDGAALRTSVPGLSGWDAEHHLAHIALANELVLRNLHSLGAGSGVLVQRGGEPVPRALELLETGLLPRGQAQAPRMVRPPERVDRALLAQWLGEARAGFRALVPTAIVPSELKVPHQILGPLDAPQWLRFAVVHTHHHLAIASELLAAQGCAATALPAPYVASKG